MTQEEKRGPGRPPKAGVGQDGGARYLGFYASPHLARLLDATAKRQYVSRSELIRDILYAALTQPVERGQRE